MSNINKMTVTKGLAELKLLDARITRSIYENEFVGHVVGQEKKVGHIPIEEFEKEVSSTYNSTLDLIAYRNRIKSAIVESNAKTKVNIAGTEYTVAEAIERKNSIQYEQELLHKMKSAYANRSQLVDRINEKVQIRLDDSLKSMFEGDSKPDNEFIEQFTENFNSRNKAKLVDPLGIKDKIDSLEKEIEDFLSEVDHELSVSNATTIIEVEV